MSETIYENLIAENRRLSQWIDDLQSGQLVTCEFCGHRYGPIDLPEPVADHSPSAGGIARFDEVGRRETPMQSAFKLHLAVCSRHPAAMLLRCCRLAKTVLDMMENKNSNHRLVQQLQSDLAKALASIKPPASQRKTG